MCYQPGIFVEWQITNLPIEDFSFNPHNNKIDTLGGGGGSSIRLKVKNLTIVVGMVAWPLVQMGRFLPKAGQFPQ